MTIAPPMRRTMPAPTPAPAASFELPSNDAVAPFIGIYAVEGFGKTTAGAYSENPAIIMAPLETGYLTLQSAGRVPAVPQVVAKNWLGLLAIVDAQLANPICKTLVLDAIGGLERLCHEYVCAHQFKNDWSDKGFYSFGRGPEAAVTEWLKLLSRLDRLRTENKITIVMLGHAKIKPFKNPLGSDFDRYIADCHEKTWGVTCKNMDALLFGQFRTIVTDDRGGKGKGIGGTDRVIYAERRDGFDAKNRFGMPAEIDMPDDPAQVWNTIWSNIKREG